MAMKTNFEEADFISSPFVDEIANQGVPGISNEEVERQAIRANQLFLAKQRATAIIAGGGGAVAASKPTAPPATPSGFAGPGLKGRRDFINEELLGNKKK